MTDSGGVQKEAYFFKVPCITLRENTEWVETVEDGWNVLVGANKELIVQMVREFNPNKTQRDVFGDGRASERIGNILDTNNMLNPCGGRQVDMNEEGKKSCHELYSGYYI